VYKAHAGVGGDKTKFYGYIESHPSEFADCQKVLLLCVLANNENTLEEGK